MCFKQKWAKTKWTCRRIVFLVIVFETPATTLLKTKWDGFHRSRDKCPAKHKRKIIKSEKNAKKISRKLKLIKKNWAWYMRTEGFSKSSFHSVRFSGFGTSWETSMHFGAAAMDTLIFLSSVVGANFEGDEGPPFHLY